MTFTARPTTYKGIAMRSRLEAGLAQEFDSVGIEWQYEPRAFANEVGQYLPDFFVPAQKIGDWQIGDQFIEAKPVSLGDDALDAALDDMHIIRSSLPGAALFVYAGRWSAGGIWHFKVPRLCMGRCSSLACILAPGNIEHFRDLHREQR